MSSSVILASWALPPYDTNHTRAGTSGNWRKARLFFPPLNGTEQLHNLNILLTHKVPWKGPVISLSFDIKGQSVFSVKDTVAFFKSEPSDVAENRNKLEAGDVDDVYMDQLKAEYKKFLEVGVPTSIESENESEGEETQEDVDDDTSPQLSRSPTEETVRLQSELHMHNLELEATIISLKTIQIEQDEQRKRQEEQIAKEEDEYDELLSAFNKSKSVFSHKQNEYEGLINKIRAALEKSNQANDALLDELQRLRSELSDAQARIVQLESIAHSTQQTPPPPPPFPFIWKINDGVDVLVSFMFLTAALMTTEES